MGAATEKGTSRIVDSRFSEVTVISSERWAASVKLTVSVAPASRRRSLRLCFPKPLSVTVTLYGPAGTLAA